MLLARSGELLREQKYQEALDALDADEQCADQPRILRQRALLLLQLERFAEAEALVAELAESPSPVLQQFLAKYPSLAFAQRMRAACRQLRAGEADEALELLANLQPTSPAETLELAYAQAFGWSLQGYQFRRRAQLDAARRLLTQALSRVEGVFSEAQQSGHERLLKLYEKLDNDVDRLQDQFA